MTLGKNLKKWQRKDAISVARLNEMQESILTALTAGKGIDLTVAGNRIVISLQNEKPVNVVDIQRFKVVGFENDYLVCLTLDKQSDDITEGISGNSPIPVAKPYLLRKTPFDANSTAYTENADGSGAQTIDYTYSDHVTREATDGDSTETQVITPAYFYGDEILAILRPSGGTGLNSVTFTYLGVEYANQKVVWEDLNTAARFWAREASGEGG